MFTFGHVHRNVVQLMPFSAATTLTRRGFGASESRKVSFTRPDIAVSSAADYSLTTINLGKSRPLYCTSWHPTDERDDLWPSNRHECPKRLPASGDFLR